MKHLKLENGKCYDGSQIQPMWAFRTFGIKDSSIISWVGPMKIEPDHLVDFEDAGLEIKGNNMLHFIVEHFDVQPANISICYHRQRILVMIIKDILQEFGIFTSRSGDDLYIKNIQTDKIGKLSVSIATCSISSMKIHFAMNLTENGTPKNIEVASLFEFGLNNEDISKVTEKICENYIMEINSITKDISKTKVF
ncbi:MAG: DUF366 family protein [Methanobacterium sp.]|nr:DUF366 family protein [Methanobacterium sp.]